MKSFNEKLDLLMNLTNTTNSILARAISVDPSFVSRLRRGLRSPAKNENYIKPMSDYIARNCTSAYQRAALKEAMKRPDEGLPYDAEALSELILEWFSRESGERKSAVESFMKGLSNFQFRKMPGSGAIDTGSAPKSTPVNGSVFYGVEGKRSAVIHFLSLVLGKESPTTLLLFSDENMEWLTENREFTDKWASLLFQVLMKGNKIKIIHTVSRSLDEILAAIENWLPMYMTGNIEPYYYPKTRDGIFRRTLFIAAGTAAVTSSSVGEDGAKSAANVFFTDSHAIKALTEEYKGYFFLCHPLMRIFTSKNTMDYLGVLSEFEEEEGHRVLKTDMLSAVTMPLEVAESIYSRMESKQKEDILAYHRRRVNAFENSLKKYNFAEIVKTPDVDTVQCGKAAPNSMHVLTAGKVFYTVGEYRRHLENIIRLLKSYDKYSLHLVTNIELEGCMLYCKEDVGVFIEKQSLPPVTFALNERNMSSAFWDYLRLMLNKLSKDSLQRKHTINTLYSINQALKALE
ncbi:MAG: transcriptional regulator [Clostridiales bacterium]|nr:transcriptional regulator [Clostridiales bacterium]MCF8021608.1 transcriptional regulator [Clostridiales bacterium]